MKKLFAIVGREWRAYFLSPLAYVILTAYMFLNGFIFSRIVAFLSTPGVPRERFLPKALLTFVVAEEIAGCGLVRAALRAARPVDDHAGGREAPVRVGDAVRPEPVHVLVGVVEVVEHALNSSW